MRRDGFRYQTNIHCDLVRQACIVDHERNIERVLGFRDADTKAWTAEHNLVGPC